MRDHPMIKSLEQRGLPTWDDGREPVCPVCGERCGTIYRDKFFDVVGCDECVTTYDAWEWMEEQE